MQKTTTTGIMERFVPVIDGRVVCYCTWSLRSDRCAYPKLEISEYLGSRWCQLVGVTAVTGYPFAMEALLVAERAEQWASEAMLELGELLETEVRSCWYPTKDGVPMCGSIPASHNNYGDCHPFHFDHQTLDQVSEEDAIIKARAWHQFWEKEAAAYNRGPGSKGGMQWVAVTSDSRI